MMSRIYQSFQQLFGQKSLGNARRKDTPTNPNGKKNNFVGGRIIGNISKIWKWVIKFVLVTNTLVTRCDNLLPWIFRLVKYGIFWQQRHAFYLFHQCYCQTNPFGASSTTIHWNSQWLRKGTPCLLGCISIALRTRGGTQLSALGSSDSLCKYSKATYK